MKWNWGTKLMLVFSLFASAMIMLVIMSMRQKVQMVAQDYYKDELHYQQVIDATSMANTLSKKASIIKSENQIVLQLPHEMNGAVINGRLLFYCASESAKDQQVKLQTDLSGKQVIAADQFKPGNYTVKIEWQFNGKQYYTELPLTI